MSDILGSIQTNFVTKMNDIREMKEVIALMMSAKTKLIDNIFSERNFKLPAETIDKTK
jgi:hypothetical protein